jgi:hypothetical protein
MQTCDTRLYWVTCLPPQQHALRMNISTAGEGGSSIKTGTTSTFGNVHFAASCRFGLSVFAYSSRVTTAIDAPVERDLLHDWGK